jgi:hypothetical protein
VAVTTAATAALLLTSSLRAGPARATPMPPASRAVTGPVLVLQMNLCNSGMALSCYSSGRAVDEAVARIHRYRPDVVTVQEVCFDDLYVRGGWGLLARAMADLYGSGRIGVDFQPAGNRHTHGTYRCVDGEPYGVAVIHRGNGRDVHSGWYRAQDRGAEVRTWTCATVVTGRLTACTTHLSINGNVALRQCQELKAVLASPWLTPEVVVAGDFNLTSQPGQAHDAGNCAAPGYERRDDGALQQVFFTGTLAWLSGGHERMRWTDHPLLYERFRI